MVLHTLTIIIQKATNRASRMMICSMVLSLRLCKRDRLFITRRILRISCGSASLKLNSDSPCDEDMESFSFFLNSVSPLKIFRAFDPEALPIIVRLFIGSEKPYNVTLTLRENFKLLILRFSLFKNSTFPYHSSVGLSRPRLRSE